MLNNTVNGEMHNSAVRSLSPNKKKFKAAGLRNTPKVVAVEIRQEDKEKIRSLKTGNHMNIPTLVAIYKLNGQDINMVDFLQAPDSVGTKAYLGTKKEEMEKKKNAEKEAAKKAKEDRESEK